MILQDELLEIIVGLFIEWYHSNSLYFMIIIYLTKIIHFFYQYHTIQSQNGQEKRKIRAKKIVYNVKKITKRKSTIC